MMKKLVRIFVASSLSVTLASVAAAQSLGFSPSDSKELASYRLTMETTTKVMNAMRSLFQEASRDPRVQAL